MVDTRRRDRTQRKDCLKGARKPRWRWFSPWAAVVAVGLGGVCAAWAVAATRGGWLGQALRSRLTLAAGGVLLGSAVALCLLAGTIWRLGRGRRPQRAGGSEGTAALEFALLFPLALAIALVMVQSSQLVTHNVVAHYAAYIAARSAIVWVPENISLDEPRNYVSDPDTSEKMRHIHMAAVLALCGASPGKPGAGGAGGSGQGALHRAAYERLYSYYGEPVPAWISRRYEHMYEYALKYTQVDLARPRNGAVYGEREDLSVTVRHTLFLSVPYANRVFALGPSGRALPDGEYGTEVEITYTLTNQGVEDEIDVEVFPRYVGRGQQ